MYVLTRGRGIGSVHVCMYVCMYIRVHVCMYVCMYIRVHVCMYMCVYVCMYVLTRGGGRGAVGADGAGRCTFVCMCEYV